MMDGRKERMRTSSDNSSTIVKNGGLWRSDEDSAFKVGGACAVGGACGLWLSTRTLFLARGTMT